jgi:hypothetical protein
MSQNEKIPPPSAAHLQCAPEETGLADLTWSGGSRSGSCLERGADQVEAEFINVFWVLMVFLISANQPLLFRLFSISIHFATLSAFHSFLVLMIARWTKSIPFPINLIKKGRTQFSFLSDHVWLGQGFLGAKKRLYKRLRRLVGRSVRLSVGLSVPMMQLRGKLVTSRLLREEEEEEENWLRRYSFAPRD